VQELPDELRDVIPPTAPGTVLGKIEVAGTGISALFVEGVDAKSLSRAVGHVPGSAMPGQRGRIALAAHRDTFFRDLRHVKLRDRIQVSSGESAFNYEVVKTEVVTPDRTDVIAPSREPLLTLITCYPFDFVGKAPKRFIVHARLVPGSSSGI
jgi:sortase A